MLDDPKRREAINPLDFCHILIALALSGDFNNSVSSLALLSGDLRSNQPAFEPGRAT